MVEFTDFYEGQSVQFLRDFPDHNIETGDTYPIVNVLDHSVELQLKRGCGMLDFRFFAQNGGDAATLLIDKKIGLDEDDVRDLLGVME